MCEVTSMGRWLQRICSSDPRSDLRVKNEMEKTDVRGLVRRSGFEFGMKQRIWRTELFPIFWRAPKFCCNWAWYIVSNSRSRGSFREANIESSPVWDISYLAELINDLINRQLLCRKSLEQEKIQFCLPRMLLFWPVYVNPTRGRISLRD